MDDFSRSRSRRDKRSRNSCVLSEVCLSVPSTRTSSSSSPKSAYTSERVNTRLVVMLTCSLGGGDEAGVLSSTEDIANDGDGLQDMVIREMSMLTNASTLHFESCDTKFGLLDYLGDCVQPIFNSHRCHKPTHLESI